MGEVENLLLELILLIISKCMRMEQNCEQVRKNKEQGEGVGAKKWISSFLPAPPPFYYLIPSPLFSIFRSRYARSLARYLRLENKKETSATRAIFDLYMVYSVLYLVLENSPKKIRALIGQILCF